MDYFHRAFLWRLLIACCLLSALVALGGHLVATGRISALQGPRVGRRVTLIALASGLATAACQYPLLVNLYRRIFRFADDVVTGNLELASVLGAAIAQRDSETGGHNFRVTLYAFRLAEAWGDPRLDMRAMLLGAFLHDVGKIGIRDAILLKPGPLTPDEREVMQTHTTIGADILSGSGNELIEMARDIALAHHEKWDGSGYPRGLRGGVIPQAARIVAITDVFDALTSERPYKKPWSVADAVRFMSDNAGTHFDPELLPLFVDLVPQVEQIRERFAEPPTTAEASTADVL